MRKISVIHPSRMRPKEAWETMFEWTLNADNGRNIEYILVVDEDDTRLPEYKYWITEVTEGIILHVGKHKSAIDAINEGAKIATGDLLIVASDDFRTPKNWDTLLLEALEGKEDFCVKTQDGIQPVLMTLPIVDRIFYNRYGYIYAPEYSHMYADQELTAVSIMTGKAIFLDLLFEHQHYSTGKFKKDAISIKNDKTYISGKKIFDQRLRKNFGIKKPLCSYTDIKWH